MKLMLKRIRISLTVIRDVNCFILNIKDFCFILDQFDHKNHIGISIKMFNWELRKKKSNNNTKRDGYILFFTHPLLIFVSLIVYFDLFVSLLGFLWFLLLLLLLLQLSATTYNLVIQSRSTCCWIGLSFINCNNK